eukprot:g3324.t1
MEDDQENEHPVRNLVLSVTMNTRMYLHGGCDDKKAYGDLHLLEIEQMKWTELQCEGARVADAGRSWRAGDEPEGGSAPVCQALAEVEAFG